MSERLAAWKVKLAPREIELSMGSMLIRPVRLENLIASGHIPLTLAENAEAPLKPGESETARAMQNIELVNAVVIAVAVDPKVTKEGDDDSVSIDDIPIDDRALIFQEVNGQAQALASFRAKQGGGDHPGGRGPDVPDAAE